MSRFTFTLLVATVVGPAALAQAPAASPPPPVPWANKFFLTGVDKFPSLPPPPVVAHDFGTVPHGTICAHEFTVTNIYDEPMQVVEVRKSCHCLDYVPMTRVLRPNETAKFAVTMNTGKFVGPNAQTFYVTFGPKYVSTAVLKLSAVSRADVTLNPGAVAFGTVSLGSKPTQSVKVEYKGKMRDWKVLGAVPVSAPFDVQVKETGRGRLLGGAEYQVDVSLRPNAPAGPIQEQLALTTNDPTNPIVQVAVTGTIQAPLEVAPAAVRLDPVAVGQSTTQRVMVRAGKPFRVVQVDGQVDGLTVELPPTNVPLPVNFLTVKFEPKRDGPLARTLRIRTDLDGGVTAALPVEAEATK